MNTRGVTPWALSLLLHLAASGCLLGGMFLTPVTVPAVAREVEPEIISLPEAVTAGESPRSGILDDFAVSEKPAVPAQLPMLAALNEWPLTSQATVPLPSEGKLAVTGPQAEMGMPRVVLPPRKTVGLAEGTPGNDTGSGPGGEGKSDHGTGTGAEGGGFGVMVDGQEHGGLVPLVGNMQPAYPPESLRLRQQGQVRVALSIGKDGNVGEVTVLQSSGFKALDEAALAAVREWKFQKITQDTAAEQVITFAIYGR